MITRAQIVACARQYLGTPFQHQGRLRGLALDCIGLPICVARDLGLPVPNYSNYDPFPTDETVLRECRRNLTEVEPSGMKPGDILCCRVPVPCHVAIVTDIAPDLGMIHAYSPNQMVVEHVIDLHWLRRIAGVFLFPGVEG